MPRKLLYRSDWFPYHVTARTNNKVPFELPLTLVWSIFSFELWRLMIEFEIEVHAFVLMPNHFHLLVTVPNSDLGRVMNHLMSNVTREMNRVSGNTGHVFGGPYHWTTVQSARYFAHALKYVYRNPVKGGLCELVEEYEYSTFTGLVGGTKLAFPISFTRAGFEHLLPSELPIESTTWLNTPFSQEAQTLIQKGLRKREFTLRIDRETRKPCAILEQTL